MALLDRPMLWQRLDEGMERALTLICAPAGYGKTTLLKQWQQQRHWPVAWVTVDALSAEPRQIVLALAGALQAIAGPEDHVVRLPLSPALLPDAIADLLNAVAGLPHDIALVIDNHVLSAAPVSGLLAPFLDYLPRQMHIFLASRAVPDLPLGRLRMRGQVAELSAADLALTPDETGCLLAVDGVCSPAQEARTLQARSEGWVTGLRLAMGGQSEAIALYLDAEVFRPQPEHIRRFLLQTAPLDRLTATRCNGVTGRPDSQALLEMLERANLFVFPLDQQRREYRYHRLFASFLLSSASPSCETA